MPATITLKNIPDDLYRRLKEAADAHHRSLNSEVIVCLERVLLPTRTRLGSPDTLAKRTAKFACIVRTPKGTDL